MNLKILLVEDDSDLAELIAYNLKKEGYQPIICLRGAEAVKYLQEQQPDLLLLDVMLPDYDGFKIAQYVRNSNNLREIPIIFITARDMEQDKLRGFSLGADDYITKPFSLKELVARVKAVLRRVGKEKRQTHFKLGGLQVDLEKKEVKRGDELIELTPTEFMILSALLENYGKPVSREYLIERVLKRDVYDRTVDVHIKKLREKLGEEGRAIQTVRGFGYKLGL
ncbi:MAG: response regulator transcription factor [Aquificaceae bacterium]|jgi:two-component system OmpR family response regulator/two-component system phosphate regulon response regulator PhoB|uniref:response regulator n=1 Tax=Hydrogenobacter sp. Uz 6-8 TaxID=3384828 RepID=UPI0030973D6E